MYKQYISNNIYNMNIVYKHCMKIVILMLYVHILFVRIISYILHLQKKVIYDCTTYNPNYPNYPRILFVTLRISIIEGLVTK